VREATKDRIKLSQSPDYDGYAKTKVCGPWDKGGIEQAIDKWNDEVMFNALTGDNGDEDMVKNGEYDSSLML
jgi:exonuclease 3'-5' domain-containing protein 1